MPPNNAELEFKNRDIKIEVGDDKSKKMYLKDALVEEGLSKITRITAEVLTFDKEVSVEDFLGEEATIIYPNEEKKEYYFCGTCVSVEKIGRYMGGMLFILEIRPWFWFLKRVRDSRIFQEKTVIEIIEQVISDNKFSGRLTKKTTGTYKKRLYCVQYRESCYDFLCRLMEEEGIYFYFTNEGKQSKLVIADGPKGHEPLKGFEDYEFYYPDGGHRDQDHVSYWVIGESVRTGKVTLDDYNFEKSTAEIKAVEQIKKGKHKHGSYEHYDYPGRYHTEGRAQSDGSAFAEVRMESIASQAIVSKGVANVRGMSVGQTFKLKKHPFVPDGSEFMIRNATHYIGVDSDVDEDKERGEATVQQNDAEGNILANKRAKPTDLKKSGMAYRCTFDVLPKAVQYRAPQVTPWPEISGLHTALVTGPSGEEIYTDKYGRIKVQFHWDREGKKDDKTTCFVRVVMPWSGTNWGMISIPRIGQEAVIQFEEGDPDRPICTGMVYNDKNMPPYTLPSKKNETGIVTRSTKSGNAQTFHELMFDDTKGSEVVRFQSERDYVQTIKNNATVTVGLEHTDAGDFTQTIQNHRTETVKKGNHTFKVETGNETYTIEGNQDITVNGNESFTIGGNQTNDISGNQNTTVGGSTKHETSSTTLIKANSKVTLQCGPSSIELSPSGIKITAPKIDINASGMLTAKAGGMLTAEASGMATVKSSAVLVLQGSAIKIN
ncbi:MAG: type VI secretion system tip protein TssI/VgrG [Pseudomonadota bacterium]